MMRNGLGLLLILCNSVTWAQQAPVFKLHTYGPEEGLSNRHVTALVQDVTGFIWVGSVSGLDRFDGYTFRNWSVSDGLSGGRVDALRRDADGSLWVISCLASDDVATIDLLDPTSFKMGPLAEWFEQLPFLPSDVIRAGPQRTDGVVVLGTTAPARCILYTGHGTFKVIPVGGLRFEPLGTDRSGGIIGHRVNTDGEQELVRIDTLGSIRSLQQLRRGTVVETLVSGRATPGALYKTTFGNEEPTYYDTYSELVWVQREGVSQGSQEGPYTDPIRQAMNYTPLPDRELVSIDTRIMNSDGVVLYDLAAADRDVRWNVKDCMVDRYGNPWLGTEFGLFHVEIRGDAFQRLLYTPDPAGGIGVLCRGMAWRDGRLYLATEWQGAYVIEPGVDSTRVRTEFDRQYLFATHIAADGSWWRGGPNVVVREDTLGAVREYKVPGIVWNILDQVSGGILLGDLEGLHWLDPKSGVVLRWSDKRYPELERAHVMQLAHSTRGSILATTSKGIYRLDRSGRVQERWWSGAQALHRIPHDDLHHCHVDASGAMWLSTRGAGLVYFDPRTGKHEQYDRRNGFPNNMVYAAYEDSQAQLWISTDGGLVRFDKGTRQSTVFTKLDGLANDEFNRLAHTRSPDGRLFFGGLNGITVVDPDRFLPQHGDAQAPLVLTGFQRYSRADRALVDHTAELLRSGKIDLHVQDRSVQISFALLTFEGAGRVLYAWRLSGVEEDWNYQYTPSVRLDRLPFGSHVLEIKARDASGQWSRHQIRVPILVEQPWQASRWLWALVGAGAASVLLLLWFWLRRTMLARGPEQQAALV